MTVATSMTTKPKRTQKRSAAGPKPLSRRFVIIMLLALSVLAFYVITATYKKNHPIPYLDTDQYAATLGIPNVPRSVPFPQNPAARYAPQRQAVLAQVTRASQEAERSATASAGASSPEASALHSWNAFFATHNGQPHN